MKMTSLACLTDADKVRFICSNHALYRSLERLTSVMDKMQITFDKFDVHCEKWFETNDWWNDAEFVDALKQSGINV